MSHQNSHVEVLTPSSSIFGGKVFKEVIKLKSGCLGWALIQYGWCPYKKKKRHQACAHTEERPCEDTVSRHCKPREEASGEAKPTCHLNLGLLASRTVGNFYCLRYTVCGILLWQPEQTNTSRDRAWIQILACHFISFVTLCLIYKMAIVNVPTHRVGRIELIDIYKS